MIGYEDATENSGCCADGNRGREGGVSMGVLLCSSGTDAFPYLLPREKQTLAAYMKGSFPAAWRRNRAIIEFERGRKEWD